jgi:hypothetical protein
MAFAELWLPILGAGICIAWAIGAWYGGNKPLAIWLVFVGLVCLLLLLALQAQRAVEKSDAPKSDEAEIKRQRAYVLLDSDKILETLTVGVGKEPEFMLRVKNVGQTPAYKLGVVHGSASGPWPLPPDTDLTIKSTGEVRDISPPGNVTFWGTNADSKGKAVTQAEFDAFKTGALRFYIFGRITYRDIYGADRYTNFCLSIVPPTDPQSAAGFGIQRCAQHNDSN